MNSQHILRMVAASDARLPPWSRRASPLFRAVGALLSPWVKLTIHRAPASTVKGRQTLYVLDRDGFSNRWIAEMARSAGSAKVGCAHIGWHARSDNTFVLQDSPLAWLPGRYAGGASAASLPLQLRALLEAHREDATLDVELVPVSIFIGRAPNRARGWLAVLFSESWGVTGPVGRLLALLLNGRDTHVHYSAPVSLRKLCQEGTDPARATRKLGRILRSRFRNVRAAVIGPDLSTRRVLIAQVVQSPSIREAIREQAGRGGVTLETATNQALAYAREIAADYSPSVVRLVSLALAPLWNRVYRGLTVNNLDGFREAARGHEVVYVPCHRSHMDYLLLSYLLYRHSIVPPHIAAGVNLNLPLVGAVLRRCGAFYLRRNTKGSPLYSAVFAEYMGQLIARGHSIEYFIEGGRSRTGRLQPPKGGTLSMTVRAFLRQRSRPVLFQPVYIGYERIIEGASYIAELSGTPKTGETLWQLLASIPRLLRTDHGRVTVNFGEPVYLADVLDDAAPGWDGGASTRDRPTWLTPVVDELARRVNVNVNRAADANPVNLLAMALLSGPGNAMAESDLLEHLTLLKRLIADAPYSEGVTATDLSPASIVARGEALGMVTRTRHPLGDVLHVSANDAALLTYYRNNTLHLFVPAGFAANVFLAGQRVHREELQRLASRIYPFLKDELFLPWTEEGFVEQVELAIEVLLSEQLLARSGAGRAVALVATAEDDAFLLRGLGYPLRQAFQRYYIALSILAKHGSGTLKSGRLEALCHQAAQRLTLLHGPAAPEFFDKPLFRGFARNLRVLGLAWIDAEGNLAFGERLSEWAADASRILDRDLRHAIDRISPGASAAG